MTNVTVDVDTNAIAECTKCVVKYLRQKLTTRVILYFMDNKDKRVASRSLGDNTIQLVTLTCFIVSLSSRDATIPSLTLIY